MIKPNELKEITRQSIHNIKTFNILYIETVIERFETKYKKDIRKIEKNMLQQANKGIYFVTFQKQKLDTLEAKAYREGIINYFQKLGYKISVKSNEYYTLYAGKQYIELNIIINWEE